MARALRQLIFNVRVWLGMNAVPFVLLPVFVLPVILGVLGTWLPAFGYFPSIGRTEFTLAAFSAVIQYPGIVTSISASVLSALLATSMAFLISQWLCMYYFKSRMWQKLQTGLAPLLAIPHLAFAIGFSFLVAPSGWMLRLISPWLSGFDLPPDWLILNDKHALSLSLVLMLKEIPFFLLMSLSALSHFDGEKTLHIARSFGYSRMHAWIKLVFIQMYPQLRLPIFAVLSYSLSVVDLSIVLGPSAPPTFAVLINRWFNDADIDNRLLGAAASMMLFLLVLILILLVCQLERLLKKGCKLWLIAGVDRLQNKGESRNRVTPVVPWFLWSLWSVSFMVVMALIILSFSQRWRFPQVLPETLSLKHWQRGWDELLVAVGNTLSIGLSVALVALVLTIAILQWQISINTKVIKRETLQRSITALIYVPLLLPQVSFLFGVQVFYTYFSLEGQMWSVIWLHLIFVLPYTYLTLSKVYLEYDERYMSQALSLSNNYWRSFIKIKLAMMTKPIAFTFATGFAVSSAQYLATIYAGAGRYETLTTHTVTLASGSNMHLTSATALWQMLLPLLVYGAALIIPSVYFRRRRAM